MTMKELPPQAASDTAPEASSDEPQTPDTLVVALQFLKQARHDLTVRTHSLERQQKDWDAEQERYAALFNAAPDGYFVTDSLGVIRDASRVAAALLHIAPSHLPGKPLINFVAMEDRTNLRRALVTLQKAKTNDAAHEAEFVEFVRVTPRAAPPFESLLRITPLAPRPNETRPSGDLQWFLCDISKRVRAETERYRLMMDALEDYAVLLMDASGRITSWNRGAEKAFGWRERDVLGQPYSFLFAPENAGVAAEELSTARETGRFFEDGPMKGRDKTFWTQGVLLALPSGSTNGANGIGGDIHRAGFAKILRDMTDKQREEQELRQREARLSLALQAARAASWSWSADTDTPEWSAEYAELARIAPSLAPSRAAWFDAIHPADRARAAQDIQTALQNNLPLSSEYRTLPAPGMAPRWILSLGQPITDAQNCVVEIVGVILDITDRKETEAELETRVQKRTRELAQANARIVEETNARNALMQKIVTAQEDERRRISRELHDTMGQHLTAFSLNLRVLEDAYLPSSDGKPILLRLRRIADELSRDLHQMAVDLRPTALDDLGLANALRSYVENWKERVGIYAEFAASGFDDTDKSSETLPAVVETTLYRIVQEALNNIARHSGATRAEVTFSRYDHTAVLVIEDNGSGFDPEPLFAPRTPSDENNTANPPREHLGLLGMAERAQTIGGTFTIESEAGSGTSIFVRLPLR